jgi:hypothetical protein
MVFIVSKLTIVLKHIRIDCNEHLQWSQSHTQAHTGSTNKFTSVNNLKHWVTLMLTDPGGHRCKTAWHLSVRPGSASQTDARRCAKRCEWLTAPTTWLKKERESARHDIYTKAKVTCQITTCVVSNQISWPKPGKFISRKRYFLNRFCIVLL